MLTFREARQRLELAEMGISRVGSTTDFRVFFPEDKDNAATYYTDDLEDAMLTGLRMRRHRGVIAA